MTTWADIIAAAMVLIDDVRLEEQLATSPAQFYRRMAGWINQAYTKLSKPPELLAYLKSEKTDPEFDDYLWESTAASVTDPETVVPTGKIGYELCSVTVRVQHPNGTISLTPYPDATYDAETGNVTFPQQAQEGIGYDIDFYTDGAFPTLSDAQMRLAALAVATLWDERFARNWLAIGPKIHDESFEAPNEPQYMEKSGKRLHENIIAFEDELRAYEQICAYTATVRNGNCRVTLV